LETVDGVEIASSYKEYLNLALGDLDDRLNKSNLKLADIDDRSVKRTALVQEIEREVLKRQAYARALTKKDKFLRARLLRNTEMKSAMQNLAVIAGYKLDSHDNRKDQSLNEVSDEKIDVAHEENLNEFDSVDQTTGPNDSKTNITNVFVDQLVKNRNNSSYTKYIQMAYDEIDASLTNDKLMLIDIIRRLKTNEAKLKELDHLKTKVAESLVKLSDYKVYLKTMIAHDSQIAQNVKQLEQQIDNVRKVNEESNKMEKNILQS
jgi:hypothetical protein